MRVTVYYFALLQERMGKREEILELASCMTVSALYFQIFPEGKQGGRIPVMYAVNQKYVDSSHPLQDGDEVAFIPPIGGG